MFTISPVWAAVLVFLTVAVIGTLIGLLVSAFVPAPLATMKRFLSILAGLLTAVILGLLIWLLITSGFLFSRGIAVTAPPVVVSNPALGAPAGSPATSCTARRLMTVAEATNLVDATSADEYADSLTVLFGRQVDTQCLQDSTSTVGGWQVNGPAVILTDPGHMPISGARVVKTWHFQTDWIFGVYFCPAGTTCTVPTPGRAVYLDGNLPSNFLH